MADALQDFVTMTQAASGLIGSLGQLQDTRIKLESDRIASEVGKMNSDFLLRMSAPIGSPQRIDMNNWRDELQRHNEELGQRLSTIQSPTIKTTVEARLGEITNGFMVNISNKMVGQEIEKAQVDLYANIETIKNTTGISIDERLSQINALMKYAADNRILSPEKYRILEADLRSSIYAEKLVEEQSNIMQNEYSSARKGTIESRMSEYSASIVDSKTGSIKETNLGNASSMEEEADMTSKSRVSKEEAIAATDKEVKKLDEYRQKLESSYPEKRNITPEEVAIKLSTRTDIDKRIKDAAVQNLGQQQKSLDEQFKTSFDSVFTENEKDGSVKTEVVANLIMSSGASKAEKQKAASKLQNYIVAQEGKSVKTVFNGWMEMQMEDRIASSDEARAFLRGVEEQSAKNGFGWAKTNPEEMLKLYKEVDTWKLENAGLDKLKTQYRGEIVRAIEQFADKNMKLEQFYMYINQDKYLNTIPDMIQEENKKIRDGSSGVDKEVLTALNKDDGLINSVVQTIAFNRANFASGSNAERFIKEVNKSGKDNNDLADAQYFQLKTELGSQLRDIIVRNGTYNEKAQTEFKNIVIKKLSSTSLMGSRAMVDTGKGLEKELVQFYNNTAPEVISKSGEVSTVYAEANQQLGYTINRLAGDYIPGFDSDKNSFRPDMKNGPDKGKFVYIDEDSKTKYKVSTAGDNFVFDKYKVKDGMWVLERRYAEKRGSGGTGYTNQPDEKSTQAILSDNYKNADKKRRQQWEGK